MAHGTLNPRTEREITLNVTSQRYIRLLEHLSVCLSVCQAIYLAIYPSGYVSVYLAGYISINLATYQAISMHP